MAHGYGRAPARWHTGGDGRHEKGLSSVNRQRAGAEAGRGLAQQEAECAARLDFRSSFETTFPL